MLPDRPFRVHTRRSWWIWVAYWVLLFVVMHIPIDRDVRMPIEHGDKIGHMLGYFLLTWLGGRRLTAAGGKRHSNALFVWGAIYLGYAALDEWLQGFVGRTASFADWCGDVVGILMATLLLFVRRRRADYRNHGPAGGSNVTRG